MEKKTNLECVIFKAIKNRKPNTGSCNMKINRNRAFLVSEKREAFEFRHLNCIKMLKLQASVAVFGLVYIFVCIHVVY